MYYAKGLCKTCYARNWRKEHPKNEKVARIKYRRKIGMLPMDENKECSLYLGVHVAERVLSKVFENVIRQPPKNRGFDFICGHGFKIDVKSSCIRHRKWANHSWIFNICKNKIADYFLCLAFDDRKKLTPIHIWLLPAEKFNHLTIAGISTSTIDKWNGYTLDIDRVSECCNVIRT